MTYQVKAKTLNGKTGSNSDPHARYHDRDWLTVVQDAGEFSVEGVLVCRCSCDNVVYIQSEEVYRRREIRPPRGLPVRS